MKCFQQLILEEYIGTYYTLFLYIGDYTKPIMVYVTLPTVIGVLRDNDDIAVYHNKLQISRVPLADPCGIEYTREQVADLIKLTTQIIRCPVSYEPGGTPCLKDLKSPGSQK